MEGTWSWRRGSIISSSLILLVLCVGLWILLEPKCAAAVAAQPSSLVPLPFLVFVAYEILVILHHLARILMAKLVGLKFLAFACGPFAIRRIRERTRLTWNNRETMISGTTVFAPKTLEGLRWRCFWLIASGPLAMIIAGCFFLGIVQVTDPARPSIDTLFFAAMAFMGVSVGVRFLLPLPLRRSVSNGTLLWDTLRGRATGEVLFLVSALVHDGQQGVRPRDWSPKILDLALRLTEKTDLPERATVCFLAFYRALDLREIDRASRYLDEAVGKVNPKSQMLYSWVMLEKAFFEAWFKRDELKAREAFERVKDWTRIPHHTWLRASAAIAFVEGRPEDCHRQAQEALNIVQALPVVQPLAVNLLEELLAGSEVRC
ncbi:MAG: hypothetical protein JO207_04240 [Verrucomicrobia bacterium]|jgi:hypothetical protein|nr:hypothetical protein [Verrucomicrobiota bacterium]